MGMSKLDQIMANSPKVAQTRRKRGFLSPRARAALLMLTTLLLLFVFFTQPHVRAAFDSLLG